MIRKNHKRSKKKSRPKKGSSQDVIVKEQTSESSVTSTRKGCKTVKCVLEIAASVEDSEDGLLSVKQTITQIRRHQLEGHPLVEQQTNVVLLDGKSETGVESSSFNAEACCRDSFLKCTLSNHGERKSRNVKRGRATADKRNRYPEDPPTPFSPGPDTSELEATSFSESEFHDALENVNGSFEVIGLDPQDSVGGNCHTTPSRSPDTPRPGRPFLGSAGIEEMANYRYRLSGRDYLFSNNLFTSLAQAPVQVKNMMNDDSGNVPGTQSIRNPSDVQQHPSVNLPDVTSSEDFMVTNEARLQILSANIKLTIFVTLVENLLTWFVQVIKSMFNINTTQGVTGSPAQCTSCLENASSLGRIETILESVQTDMVKLQKQISELANRPAATYSAPPPPPPPPVAPPPPPPPPPNPETKEVKRKTTSKPPKEEVRGFIMTNDLLRSVSLKSVKDRKWPDNKS